jgi:hypothetical protein
MNSEEMVNDICFQPKPTYAQLNLFEVYSGCPDHESHDARG